MKSYRMAVLGCVFAVVSNVGCAAADEGAGDDEQGQTEDMVQGSPTEEREREAARKLHAYQGEFVVAYDNAPAAVFDPLQASALRGEAATDFATMTRNCTAAKTYKVTAQRWNATGLPADVAATGKPAKVARKLFTIDAYSSKNKRAMFVGIYDEQGKLILGRKYFEHGSELLRATPEEFRTLITACEPPKFG
jgi:hypothetical protein